MLISKILCSILAVAPTLSSAHSIIIGAIGDADSSVQGHAIGVVQGTSRKDDKQYSGQRDATIFSFPTIPDKWCKKCVQRYKPKCKKCLSTCWKKKYAKKNKLRMLKRTTKKKKAAKKKKPAAKKKAAAKKKPAKAKAKAKAKPKAGKKTGKCWKYVKNCKQCAVYDFNCLKCRQPLVTGCGRTFFVEQSSLYTLDNGAQPKKMCCGAKSPYYGLGSTNVENWVNQMAQSKTIPQIRSGGYLELKIHQVNADGAGPYRCVLDKMGTGAQFDQTALRIIGKNVPGWHGTSKYKLRKWKLIVQMPNDPGCSGSYNGAKNICMVRCQNEAANGPFGGCIPVQLVGGTPGPAPKNEYPDPPEDKDVIGEEDIPDAAYAYVQGKTAEQDDGSDETADYGPTGVEEEDDPDAVEEYDSDESTDGENTEESDEEGEEEGEEEEAGEAESKEGEQEGEGDAAPAAN